MRKQYVGTEYEFEGYAPVYLRLPERAVKAAGKFLPRKLAKKLEQGVKLKSLSKVPWKKLYDKFLKEGGVPQERKKFGFKLKGVWLPDGGNYYGDLAPTWPDQLREFFLRCGYHYPELCTPITEVKKGFAEEATRAVMAQRARAVKAVGKGGKVEIASMHYNISVDVGNFDLGDIPRTLAPAYALMLFSGNGRFYGLAKRSSGKKGGGVEIKRPVLMDPEQLEAAYAFLAGTLRGVEKRGGCWNAPVRMTVDETPDYFPKSDEYERIIKFESGTDYELPILKDGPDAILKTDRGSMTARQYFKAYLDFYRKDIEEVATGKEMRTLDDLAGGKRAFEIERRPSYMIDEDYIRQTTGKTPDEVIADFEPTGAAALFADSVKNRVKQVGKFTRETKRMDWGKIAYEFRGGKDGPETVEVSLDNADSYVDFEKKLSSGEMPYVRNCFY